MNDIRRPPTGWKTRATAALAGVVIGWSLLADTVEKKFSARPQLEQDLVLLLGITFCGFLGLLLPDLHRYLESRTRHADKINLPIRFLAAAAVGSYILTKFFEGCFAGLALLSFSIFLLIIFRWLRDDDRELGTGHPVPIPPDPPSLTPRGGNPPSGPPGGPPTTGAGRRGLQQGVEDKLREFVAMVFSGLATGFLGGVSRAVFEFRNPGEEASPGCLFMLWVLLAGMAIRYVASILVQDVNQRKGWKRSLILVDGFLMSTLLVAVSISDLPPAVLWDGTISRNPLFFVLIGLVLGFVFSLFLWIVKKALLELLKIVAKGKALSWARELTEGIPPLPREAFYPAGGAALAAAMPSVNPDPKPADRFGSAPPRTGEPSLARVPAPIARRSSSGCSCLLAIAALAAGLVFATMHKMGMGHIETSGKDLGKLPPGCPKRCAGAQLWNLNLEKADFSGADFTGANLGDTKLDKVNFRGAVLKKARLYQAHLRNADLSGADLSGADLRSTILLGAKFQHANLRGVYLEGASLQDLDLSSANLTGAHLKGAVYSSKTQWPPGFNVSKAQMILDP